jgi:lipoate synthase
MPIDIYRFSKKLHEYENLKRRIEDQYKRDIENIDQLIEAEKKTIAAIEEALAPVICKGCGGSGEESFLDAAGSRDTRKCRYCGGSGINP